MVKDIKYCNQDVINESCQKLEYPKFLVKRIEQHWHKFVLDTIQSGKFENILIPYLVKFVFNKRKMDTINYKNAKFDKLKEKENN